MTIDQSRENVLGLIQQDVLFGLVLSWIYSHGNESPVANHNSGVRLELTRFRAENVAADNQRIDWLLRFGQWREQTKK